MTILNELPFSKIEPEKQYLCYREAYERYGTGPHTIHLATGQEIIELLCDVYGYDAEESTLEDFLLDTEDANGEDDYFQVFDLPTVK